MKRIIYAIILLAGMALSGCASMMGASGHMAGSLDYVRQHKGQGMRRTLAGSEAELMDTAVKSLSKDPNQTIVREPHAVLSKSTSVDLSYAFYFYPTPNSDQTEVEVLIASPWLSAEQLRKFQDQAFSTMLVDLNRKVLEKGFDPNVKEQGGLLPLSSAALESQPELAKKMMAKGADPDLAINELREVASKQIPYLSYPANKNTYDNANTGIEMLTRFKYEQVKPVVAKTPSTPVLQKSVIKSDVDELPAMTAKPNKNSYAIVVGIENYRQKLPAADFATHDAQLVADYLVKVMGYPEENVVMLLNDHAALGDFVKYFERWLPNNVEQGSSVFVYYSGHGAPNPRTFDAYLVPYDGDPSFIDETGYSLKRMYAALGKLPAKEIVVALDSCFSGAGGRSLIAKGARPLVINLKNEMVLPGNMTVMTASSGDQISSTYHEKGHGLFTYFMLKGIKNGGVTRQDGSIRYDALFGYIKPQVERIARKQYNNEQSPQMIEPAMK